MSNKLDIRLKPDHVGGGFEWEREPHCSCGMLKQAVDENKFIFVNNIGDGGSNLFYMMPVSADGTLAKSDGVAKLIRFRINFLFVDHQARCHIALFPLASESRIPAGLLKQLLENGLFREPHNP